MLTTMGGGAPPTVLQYSRHSLRHAKEPTDVSTAALTMSRSLKVLFRKPRVHSTPVAAFGTIAPHCPVAERSVSQDPESLFLQKRTKIITQEKKKNKEVFALPINSSHTPSTSFNFPVAYR